MKIMARAYCDRCGDEILSDPCKGNDSPCLEGRDGRAHFACLRWDPYCCRCGPRWALDQL